MPTASSKGPAFDGRIKPELVAFGEDGSSGAAAMVSGSAALVQQAYKMQNGRVPSAASAKAVLLNSATDVATKGIDFTSGFGNLNTYAAVNTVQEGRILEDVITSNATKSFSIQVPDNAALLKVTLVWADQAATVNTPKALINDLNLMVKSPANVSWLPWVLTSKPHLDSLQKVAERKIDTLNNVEQVTIENPISGNYSLNVSASALNSDRQPFSIAYQIDTLETLYWTFPTAIDHIEAGTTSIIRWETNKMGEGVIEYSNNKKDWHPVFTIPDVRINYFKWQVPDTTTTAWLRLRSGNHTVISDTFVISSIPRMNVGFNCADSFLLFWNKQSVTQYQLYALNDKYLSSIAITNDSFSLLKKAQHTANYYSVAPVINGKVGIRSAILNYAASGVDCYFKSFFLQAQNGNSASLYSSIGSTYGVSAIALQKLQGNAFATIQTIQQPKSIEFVFHDPKLQQGMNQSRLALQLSNGQLLYSEIVSVYYFNDKDVIIYPNPVAQKQPIYILASRAGRTTIQIYSSAGMKVSEIRLRDMRQQIPPFQLNSGLYFIKIIDEENKSSSTQKLVVY